MTKARILVVEDEVIVAKILQSSLESLGYDVPVVVPSGEEAIEEAERTRPDLVLMDIILAGDMDGVEAAEQIRERFNIPVVYLTAHADDDTLQRAKITEPFGYLIKPFEERDLRTSIEIALYKHKAEEALRRRSRELVMLNEIGQAVTSSLNLNKVLALLLARARQVLDAEACSVALLNDSGDLVFHYAEGEGAEAVIGLCLKPGQGIAGRIAQSGQPALVPDVQADHHFYDEVDLGFTTCAIVGVPLVVRDEVIGVLEIINKRQGTFTEDDVRLLESVATQAAIAIENARLFQETERLKVFSEGIVQGVAEAILIEDAEGILTFANPAAEELLGYTRAELIGRHWATIVSEDQREKVRQETAKRPLRIESVYETALLNKEGRVAPVIVSARPLFEGETFTGVLSAFTDITERKVAEEMLKEYSGRLGDMVEERTRELREAQAQLLAQQRLQQEIELAAQVQASLLPRHVPSLDGFEFAATALPARYVSGDLYDFVLPDPENCHIVLADVAGKGIPAALLTSTARTLVHTRVEHEDSPATILSSVNTLLYKDLTHAEMFITFFAARLNARLGTFTYANAGHTETLWWQQASRTGRTLPATGLPIGIYADATIIEETITLRPGDVIVFYSDGITEAASPHDELFGLDRLIATVSDHAHLPTSELAQIIVEAVETFRADAPRSDDLTLVILKVLPRTISFTYPAMLDHLQKATALVRQLASAYGSDFAYQMELAASEIVTNIIEHAYRLSSGEMRGQITLLPDRIQLDLYDDGAPFDISQVPEPDPTEPQVGGHGLFVVRQLTDELIYTSATPGGNHWQLIKLAEEGRTE